MSVVPAWPRQAFPHAGVCGLLLVEWEHHGAAGKTSAHDLSLCTTLRCQPSTSSVAVFLRPASEHQKLMAVQAPETD